MESTQLKAVKKQLRREVRDELKRVGNPEELIPELTLDDKETFMLKTSQLWYLDKMTVALVNQTRSSIVEKLVKDSPLYPEILSMRRDQNEDKKETKKLEKKAMEEQGFTEEMVTKQRDQILAMDRSYHALDIAKNELKKDLEPYLEEQSIYVNWLKPIRGIDVLVSAKLLRLVGDIRRFKTPSSLWHYFGLHVVDGKAPKRKRGEQATWNPKAKSLGYLIAKGQVMSRGPFRKPYYDDYKEEDTEKHPDLRKFHLNSRALRYCAKMFLLEFWLASYRAKGLEPPSKPYSSRYHPNEDFKPIVPYK